MLLTGILTRGTFALYCAQVQLGMVSDHVIVYCAGVQLNCAQVYLFKQARAQYLNRAHSDHTTQRNWTLGVKRKQIVNRLRV